MKTRTPHQDSINERFRMLENDVQRSISVCDFTIDRLAVRRHKSLVWDASAMPAGGHYFPVYVKLLKELESGGHISPKSHWLCDTTSGNAGQALGYVARELGYKVILFMPEDMPQARISAVEENLPEGSELILSPRNEYIKGTVRQFRQFAIAHRSEYKGRQLYFVDHSRQVASTAAISECIEYAIKTVSQINSIDVAVAAIGNGTSSTALFNTIRNNFELVRCIGVEPIEAPVAYLAKYGKSEFCKQFNEPPLLKPHKLLGTGGWGVKFPHWNLEKINDIIPIRSDAWKRIRKIYIAQNLDIGNSTAACQAAVELISKTAVDKKLTFFSIWYDKSSNY